MCVTDISSSLHRLRIANIGVHGMGRDISCNWYSSYLGFFILWIPTIYMDKLNHTKEQSMKTKSASERVENLLSADQRKKLVDLRKILESKAKALNGKRTKIILKAVEE